MIDIIISIASVAGICMIFWGMKIRERDHAMANNLSELSEKDRNRILLAKISEEIEKEFAGSDLIKVIDLFRASQQYVAQQNIDNLIDLHTAVKLATPLFEEVDATKYEEDEWR